jgi:hypothetical protein
MFFLEKPHGFINQSTQGYNQAQGCELKESRWISIPSKQTLLYL